LRTKTRELPIQFLKTSYLLKRKSLSDAHVFSQNHEKKPRLLVLDEVTLAAQRKMFDIKDVLAFLDNLQDETTIVLTARLAPKELVDRADFVKVVELVKMPKDFKLTEGIQY
jgi:ATP:corrinoid adenosyltransferase